MDKLKIKIIEIDLETSRMIESNYTKDILFCDEQRCVVDNFGNSENILKSSIDRAVADPSYSFQSNIRFVIQYIEFTDFQAMQKIQELVEFQFKLHQEQSKRIKYIWNNNNPINLQV